MLLLHIFDYVSSSDRDRMLMQAFKDMFARHGWGEG